MSRNQISILRLALACSGAALLFALSAAEVSATPPPSATGSGWTVFGELETHLSFNVHATDEGAQGHANVQIFDEEGNHVHMTVELDCLRIDELSGTIAIVSGTVLSADVEQAPDVEPGDTVLFGVIDDGEGEGAVDRLSSVFSFSENVPDACQVTILESVPELANGNVQVNP